MKWFLKVAGTAYVLFAILAAHTALVTPQTTLAAGAYHQTNVATPDGPVCDIERLHQSDPRPERAPKADYTVHVWTASWCGPCRKYKRTEVPKLQKLGYTVTVHDVDDEDEPDEVSKIPMVCLHYKGELIECRVGWKANSLDEFVEKRSSFKGD